MIIIDNFVSEKNIIEEIKMEETWKNFPTYNWWDGWWKNEPSNISKPSVSNLYSKITKSFNKEG